MSAVRGLEGKDSVLCNIVVVTLLFRIAHIVVSAVRGLEGKDSVILSLWGTGNMTSGHLPHILLKTSNTPFNSYS